MRLDDGELCFHKLANYKVWPSQWWTAADSRAAEYRVFRSTPAAAATAAGRDNKRQKRALAGRTHGFNGSRAGMVPLMSGCPVCCDGCGQVELLGKLKSGKGWGS